MVSQADPLTKVWWIIFFILSFFVRAAYAQSDTPAGSGVDFSQLRLLDAEALLQIHNREVQAAKRALETAQAGTLSAGARANPALSFNMANITPSQGIGSGPLKDKAIDSTIRIDQTIERGDKRQLRMASAQNLELAATADVSETLRQQLLAVRAAYFDLLLNQDKARISAENAKLFENTLQAAELRLHAGDLATADVARIRIDALRTQNDARQAEAERVKSQLALAYLIGADDHALELHAVDPWPPADEDAGGNFTNQTLEHRPDVQAARARVDAAQANQELARSLKKRDLTVGLQYERAPSGIAGGGNADSYGFGISVPLFLGYGYEGEIKQAAANWDAARENLQRVMAQARNEMARSRADLQSAADRVKRFTEILLPEAEKSAAAAEFAFEKGAIGVMDLLDSRRTLRATQIDASTAHADYAKALAAWKASMADGRGQAQ